MQISAISKKTNDFDQPKKNGTAFKKVGQKRSKINLGGSILRIFFKKNKVPLENVPKVPCVKYESPRMNRNKQQAEKVKVSKGLS